MDELNTSNVDIVIIGGGCAGLSLACNLCASGVERKIRIVEPRSEYKNDRTWCGWRTNRHLFEECITTRWHQWRLRFEERDVIRRSEKYPYECIRADDFYAYATAMLKEFSNVELSLATSVERVLETPDWVLVQTDQGDLRAAHVFDSRPLPDPIGEFGLAQHFEGWVVHTNTPQFRPECITLMDFDVSQSRGIHFMYTLPFSETEALVENTYFSPEAFNDYERELVEYLKPLGEYEIRHKERGLIPMSMRRAQNSARISPIGMRAGLAKPTSGYAFSFIQDHSLRIAEAVRTNGWLQAVGTHARRSQLLDQVFLKFLMRNPEMAPDIFMTMFERIDPDAVVRFLTESSTLAEDMLVMRALPSRPFVREAISLAIHRR